jgi:hypothetical protein
VLDRPRIVFQLLCFGMDPEGFPAKPRDHTYALSIECARIMKQGAHDWVVVHSMVDAFHNRLLRVLEDEVEVDMRVGRGDNGIYHEPLEAALAYLGLAHKPSILNAKVETKKRKTTRAMKPHSAGAAKFWYEKYGPQQCHSCGTTTAPKLRRCPCDAVAYCSTACQKMDWASVHKDAHQKLTRQMSIDKSASGRVARERREEKQHAAIKALLL